MYKLVFFSILAITFSCNQAPKSTSGDDSKSISIDLVELSDSEYPDNPDISIRHSKYVATTMKSIELSEENGAYTFEIHPDWKRDSTICLKGIDLLEFIPTIPEHLKKDDYLSLLSVVNEEWNRNQVKWEGDDLEKITSLSNNVNGEIITRIDIARNCLNSYLWELFLYAKEEGRNKVFYHGWFSFPKELYQTLFQDQNDVPFSKYAEYLENWKDPVSERINTSVLRTVVNSKNAIGIDLSSSNYPLTGERKKKQIDIVFPLGTSFMKDFQNDASEFATFSPPGFYTKKEPRKTELGRFSQLKSSSISNVLFPDKSNGREVTLTFEDAKKQRTTQFIIAGVDFNKTPILSIEDANNGSSYSMGFGNHPFYETIKAHELFRLKRSNYYAYLVDGEGKWLDSHMVGLDGPLIHREKGNPNKLHIWLLSFERQALVGHYVIELAPFGK